MTDETSLLSEAERILKERFKKGETRISELQSDAAPMRSSERIESLVLPDGERGRMPLTKSKYLIQENEHLVQWEREVRKFLRNLSPAHEHRIAAVMIYEWATGIRIVDIMELERAGKRGKTHATWRSDLRKLNAILRFYFGKPYMTYIAGRKVPKAYKVRKGYLITRHRPMTLALWLEYREGVLKP